MTASQSSASQPGLMPGAAWPCTLCSQLCGSGLECTDVRTVLHASKVTRHVPLMLDFTPWVCTSAGGCSGLDSLSSCSEYSGWWPGRETARVHGSNPAARTCALTVAVEHRWILVK
jgi:hypothetical protein